MKKTFVIQVEYPDGDHIPTQEFVENIQEYFAANIMDGERGRLVVKPVYQPKRDSLYQECLDAVPEEIKEMVSLEVEFSNFFSLVKRMREAQIDEAAFESELDRKYRGNTWFMSTEEMMERQELCNKVFDLTTEVDEYLKKIK
jgi:hypothetical protein